MMVFGELYQLGGSTEVDTNEMSVIGNISLKIILIYLKCTLFDLAGTTNSSWTDRCGKSGRFEIKLFQVLSTMISIKHAISSD